jgi:hypothetical protein
MTMISGERSTEGTRRTGPFSSLPAASNSVPFVGIPPRECRGAHAFRGWISRESRMSRMMVDIVGMYSHGAVIAQVSGVLTHRESPCDRTGHTYLVCYTDSPRRWYRWTLLDMPIIPCDIFLLAYIPWVVDTLYQCTHPFDQHQRVIHWSHVMSGTPTFITGTNDPTPSEAVPL